jgi:hypothetical protein
MPANHSSGGTPGVPPEEFHPALPHPLCYALVVFDKPPGCSSRPIAGTSTGRA